MDSQADRIVVGFSGLPVRGGCGLRPPIYKSISTGFISDASCRPRMIKPDDFYEYIEQGFATKLPTDWSAIEKGVVLYATHDFVRPTDGHPSIINIGDAKGILHADKLLYVNYLPLHDSITKLNMWATLLIEDAEIQLRRVTKANDSQLTRVINSIMRARYCLAEVNDLGLKRRATITFAVARDLQGGDTDPIFADARLDFTESAIVEIRREEIQLKRDRASPVRHQYRDCSLSAHPGRPPRVIEQTI